MRLRVEGLRFEFASAVFASFDRIGLTPKLRGEVRLYILNGRNLSTYSLQRFLVCLYTLTSPSIDVNDRRSLKGELLKYVVDPLYVKVINSIRV